MTSEGVEDELGLEFWQLKRRRNVELLDELDEERSLVYPLHLPGKCWPDKGPLDPRAKVWEELWDDQLHHKFLEWRRSEDLAAAAKKLEELVEEMVREIGEELYPEDEGSVNGEGSEEDVDYYRT